MPITRRRRANPPEQPENNNSHLADQAQQAQPENPGEAQASEQAAGEIQASQEATHPAHPVSPVSQSPITQASPASQPIAPTPQLPLSMRGGQVDASYAHGVPGVPYVPQSPLVNGNGERGERQEHGPGIEPGRRTARGEYFRRPPQPPVQQPVAAVTSAPLQAPSHEIKLPLGREPGDATGDPLHLAYNPGYTGSEEARSTLLHKLADESKTGGRARCWNCGSLAIVYECWNTRSRSFGEVGVAYCEICGVWSVM